MYQYRLLWVLLFFSANVSSQNDCSDALIVCGNSGFSGLEVVGSGTQELVGNNSCQAFEHNSVWLKLPIKTSGTLGFILKPGTTDISEDFDFFVFGPNTDCNNLGSTIRCSSTNPELNLAPNNHTGMTATATDTFEGPGALGDSYVQWLNVVAGEFYYLVIDRPVGTSNFSLQWTGTATFEDQPELPPISGTLDLHMCASSAAPIFDLTQNDAPFIGTQTGNDLTYHTTITDMLTGNNAIANPQQFESNGSAQTIFARLTNSTTGCFDTSQFVLYVDPKLVVNIDAGFVCSDNPDYFMTLDAAMENPAANTYKWYFNSVLRTEFSPSISINLPGTYTVVAIDTFDGCITEKIFTVSDSTFPIVDSIGIVDLITDLNTVTVNITGSGNNSYAFALDEPQSYFQYSNIFQNVSPGIHEVYIKDLGACGIFGPIKINVMGIPEYFTPNGDGINDVWNLEGATAVHNSKSTIYIYDCYGKLMKQISPLGQGWDGTYNGKQMPSDDYWYTIFVEDGRSAKGHFTLKR